CFSKSCLDACGRAVCRESATCTRRRAWASALPAVGLATLCPRKISRSPRSVVLHAALRAGNWHARLCAFALDHLPPSRSALMKSVSISRLSNDALVRELKESIARDCIHTARQVALIAEVERRRLFAPAGYPSMFAYCVGELHLSEDAAYNRIQATRARETLS